MTDPGDAISQNRYARMAGFMYLLVIALYVLGDSIRSRLEAEGNFVETSHRILASEHLYRIGLCVQLSEMLFTLWLAVGLYITVRPLNRNLAVAAFLSRMAEVILGGTWVVLQFAGFYVHLAANHADAAGLSQLSALAALSSRTSSAALNVSAIFFGMGSTVFFYLFLRSRYIPKALSAFGLFASVLVLGVCFTKLIAPEYAAIADRGWLPMGIAEVLTGLWLLIKGVRVDANRAVTTGSAPVGS